MGQSVIADNWSLQDISNLVTFGVPEDQTAYLKAPHGQSHTEQSVSSAVIAFQALFDLLTDVVLRDQIIVDSGYTYAWDKHPVLAPLTRDRILKAESFFHVEQQVAAAREDLLDRLLTSESLRAAHAENVASYQERRESKHVRLGSITWGGAGMLARALVSGHPYTPHPIRRQFFLDSRIALAGDSAVANLSGAVRQGRATVRRAMRSSDRLHNLQVEMDPIPVMVIANSHSITDLVPVAMQLRGEFTGLRNWIGEYQNALGNDDFLASKKHHDLLRSVDDYVRRKTSGALLDQAILSAGISAISLSVAGRPYNWISNQFGVRATINKLVFQPSGRVHLHKVLDMFGARNSPASFDIMRHFAFDQNA